MNVTRPDNTFAPPRARAGQGRGRGRVGKLNTNQQFINLIPKYQILESRRPLVNLISSSSHTPVTPKNTRRGYGATSSSSKRSFVHGKTTTDSGTCKLTTSGGSLTDGQESFIIMAITSGRGDARGEVGLAVMDVQYPHMILSQISDCHSYINTLTKIHTFNPVEILMPDTMCEDGNNLYSTIKNKFRDLTITGISRIHFIDVVGLERIRTHCAKEFSSVDLVVHQKYYALAACAALMKYIEFIQHIQYLPKTMRIEYQVSQNTTMIDIESAQSLELVTTNGGQYNYCLFGALDRCSTPMGRRMLRASILQPPCDIEIINRRQLCIEELISNRSLHSIIQPVIRRLSGANRLLSLAMHTPQVDNILSAERNLNYILLLKNIVEIIPELRATLDTAKAKFFQNVHDDLSDERFDMMKNKILDIVHPDARSVQGYTSATMQRCFAIKSGINDMLDVARQTYCELIDDMQTMVSQLGKKYNLPLLLGCNMLLGYHIQMDVHHNHRFKIDELPKEFIQARKLKNSILMTTEPLVVLSQHCKDACEELHVLSDVLLKQILSEIREHVGCLFKLNDNIAELDLIMSLAQISSISDYAKPTFGSKLEIISSKHPVMDILATETPISNDVKASIPYNFQMITGPNMSGKTIYLKQIVLLHIMAQIGCYVPAIKAQFRIADHIFCRLGVRDDIEYNASTFTLEIKEVQYILQSVTSNSLIILDELCRSTTVEEGSSIAWIICKKLAMTSAFTFNATHFLYLLKMADLYPNITNYHIEAVPNVTNNQSDSTRLIYTHKLKQGISTIEHYGIILAKATNFPAGILKSAQKTADQIIEDLKPIEVNETESNKYAISLRKKNYDILVKLNEKLDDDEINREEICELIKEIEISNYDESFNTSEPQTLTTQEQKSTKRRSSSKIDIELSGSKRKIPKYSSISNQQSNVSLKLSEQSINIPYKAQSKFYQKNSISTVIMSQKTRNIFKNPITDPDSPLFIPRSKSFNKTSELNSQCHQKMIDSIEYCPSNTNLKIQNILQNDEKDTTSMILDNRHLLLPISPMDEHFPMLMEENNTLTPFKNNIPQELNYLRHILKNIDDNSNPRNDSDDNSSNQKNNEFFFSSDPVTRQSNKVILNGYRNLSINNKEKVNNQHKMINSISKDLLENSILTDRDLRSLTPSDSSFQCVATPSDPSYITLSSKELLISPSNSQISISTVIARKMAREKEAKIFRIIEGGKLGEENNRFDTPKSIITLGSSNYHGDNSEHEL